MMLDKRHCIEIREIAFKLNWDKEYELMKFTDKQYISHEVVN